MPPPSSAASALEASIQRAFAGRATWGETPSRPFPRVAVSLAAVLVALVVSALASVGWSGFAGAGHAQGIELSRADRLAMLYTPQLLFAPSGEPLIKIGLVEGVDRVSFRADTAFSVLPLGEGGPEFIVPANTDYEIAITDGQPGTYRWAVVVAERTPAERGEVAAVRAQWSERGHETGLAQVGSIFAVSGQRFDTRRTLVTVGETGRREEAVALADALSAEWGIDARVHGVLDDYPGGTLVMTGMGSGMRIVHRDILTVRGGPETVFTVRDVPFDVGTRTEGRETRRYVGTLLFTADKEGRLAVVNETTIERLLYGIVPAEIYPSAPAAALQAQAVAARSELLTDLGARHLAEPWMTCSDQRCQVYRGIGHEDRRTSAAVDATRGLVLADGDQVIKAYFSSNNGGSAGSNESTWGESERPYLRARIDLASGAETFRGGLADDAAVRRFLAANLDAFSNITSFASGRNFRWNVELSASELDQAVRARHDVGSVRDLRVVERDASGRITQLEIVGSRATRIIERELNIRRTLGGLRSALFVFEIDRASDGSIRRVRLDGGGFGHGVGLCQSGAIGAAERGLDVERILANYYPGTTARRLY